MKNKYFRNKSRLVFILIMIAVSSILVRLLIEYRFDNSALLYVGIPFLIALSLIQIRDPAEPRHWKKRYLNQLIDAFIIMLGSSVLLFEGFVCVVMFMPIYLIIILVMFVINVMRERSKKQEPGTLSIHVLPLLIVVSAVEGTSPVVSFDRDEQVSVTRVVNKSIAEIKHNLMQPMNLQKNRQWFLTLFPMPYDIKAGTLSPGEVHEIHFKYYRWFFSNLHTGRMLLEISEVGANHIKTTFLDDTSYIANYLQLKGTEIQLKKITDKSTHITLSINFKRKLDPYWYFSPIERYGISKTADYLITEVIAREQR